MALDILSALLGLSIGTLGTIIGVGGGFLLVPMLIFLFPEKDPVQITTLSLFAVACNAISGSIAYGLRGQIHWRSAILFSLASTPGAILGSRLIKLTSPKMFAILFAGLMFSMGIYLFFKKRKQVVPIPGAHDLTFRAMALGIVISFFVGFLASFLGIGGGVIHVPLMSEVLDFPVRLATGTSQLILAFTATVATVHHWINGDLVFTSLLFYLAGGIVVGAQLGALLAQRIQGNTILKILGGVMILASLRLALRF